MQHDCRVLADRVQHDRIVKLGRHFADNVDGFGFQPLEVCERCGLGGMGHARSLSYVWMSMQFNLHAATQES